MPGAFPENLLISGFRLVKAFLSLSNDRKLVEAIKVKVALDNGEILGIETTGYLNNHIENRDISNIKITEEEAKKDLNTDLEIVSSGLAVIPTEWKSEILCYEFKGKVDDREFLVYINTENGREEDILIITNTPNGTLTV